MSRESLPAGQSLREDANLLLQKIRVHTAMSRDVEGVHMMRTGVPPVRTEEIDEILEQRRIAAEAERAQRIDDDLNRRHAVYVSTLLYAKGEEQEALTQQSFQDAMPLADVDGRAALLAPLKTLFRITLIRCRVQERLSKVKQSASGTASKEISTAKGYQVRELHCVTKLPECSIDEEELPLPDYGETFKDMGNFSLFHNFESFEKHGFRVPFRFKTKNYTAVRFPEFSLDLTAEAAKEVDMFHTEAAEVSDIPTLRHFTQPNFTLERYRMPKHAYHFLPASRYGDFESTGNDILSRKSVAATSRKATEPISECAAPSAIQLNAGLSSIPPKLPAGRAEDSLSDSDSDDGTLERGYHPDLGWLPKPPKGKPHNSGARKVPSKNQSSAAFVHFMDRYTH